MTTAEYGSRPDVVPESNRRGELTERQRSALLETQNRAGVVGVIAIFAAIAFAGFALYEPTVNVDEPLRVAFAVGGALLVLAAAVLVHKLLALPMRARLANGYVEEADGEVIWTGRHYAARAKGRRLRWVYGPLNVPPGEYRFYLLGGTHWMLAAERTAGDPAHDDLLAALAHANRFSRRALPINRTGRLSLRQRLRLLYYSGSRFTLLILVVLAVFVAVTVLGADTAVAAAQQAWESASALEEKAVLLVIALTPVAMLGALALALSRKLLDALGGRVEMVEGTGKRILTVPDDDGSRHYENGQPRMSRSEYYQYQIHDRRFRVSRRAYNALVHGGAYRAYYAPRTGILVNIEPAE